MEGVELPEPPQASSFKKKRGNNHEIVTMGCAEPQGIGTPEPHTEHTRCPSPTGPSAGGG